MLKGKTALITGSNRGIGRALIEAFAKDGADILAHARAGSSGFVHDMQRVATLYGVNVRPIFFDLLDVTSMKSAIRAVVTAGIPIDILINNAGVAHGGLFQMTPINEIRRVFEVNFFSQLELTQIISRIMCRQKSGSIVNIATIAGLDLQIGNVAYGVSKAALMAATKTLASELAHFNVRVNAVAPGLTDTEMAKLMDNKAEKAMVNRSAMKRMARVEEIADVALFLASDRASFINGQVLRVDGGSE